METWTVNELVKREIKKIKFLQLSETSADDRGISARIGKPWTSGGDVSVDRLMWQAVCVVGRRLSGGSGSSSSSSSSSSNSSNSKTCLPVIKENIITERVTPKSSPAQI